MFNKEYLDVVLVPFGLFIMISYHIILLYRCLRLPHTTVIGFENNDKKAWVEKIMQSENRDVSTALNVLSANISVATFLASISLSLSALIGAWMSSNTNVFESDLIYGDIRPATMSIKYITLLICFLLAFSCFVHSSRCFIHANYLISTPDSDIPIEYVALAVIRGGDFWSVGLRALYFAMALLMWFFGPIPMFVTSVATVVLLHYLDSDTASLKEKWPLGKQRLRKFFLQSENRDVSTALNVLSSNISVATFLASISLSLSALIGAWMSSNTNVFESDLIYGDIRPATMSIKYITLLICFLLAFSCFIHSSRCFIHANYLISTPDSDIPIEYVALAVIRGGDFWSVGLRALYFAMALLMWFFGPIPMFVTSVATVVLLHYLDSDTASLKEKWPLGKQRLRGGN